MYIPRKATVFCYFINHTDKPNHGVSRTSRQERQKQPNLPLFPLLHVLILKTKHTTLQDWKVLAQQTQYSRLPDTRHATSSKPRCTKIIIIIIIIIIILIIITDREKSGEF